MSFSVVPNYQLISFNIPFRINQALSADVFSPELMREKLATPVNDVCALRRMYARDISQNRLENIIESNEVSLQKGEKEVFK